MSTNNPMTEDEWAACESASTMLRALHGRAGQRKLRLLACACARSRWSGLVEEEYRRAVEVAEQCADGLADRSHLRAAADDTFYLGWGGFESDRDAVAVAEATIEDFAGTAADGAVRHIPGEAPDLIRELFGDPFGGADAHDCGTSISPEVRALAQRAYDDRRFDNLPVLAELLADAGCEDVALLSHLRSPRPHYRGCWALDAILDLGQGPALVSDADWLNATRPFEMMRWWEYFRGKPSPRKHRLLACAAVRLIWHLATDSRLRRAVEVAEAFADHQVAPDILTTAHEEALALGLARGAVLEHMSSAEPGWQAVCDAWRIAHAAASAADPSDAVLGNAMHHAAQDGGQGKDTEDPVQAALVRDVLGNPLRPVIFDPDWRTPEVVALAERIYVDRAFGRMPALGDSLVQAGCRDEEVVGHCRSDGMHIRGCWVVDLALGRK
jgi:hypothetical protein